jgi:hypothetical protein
LSIADTQLAGERRLGLRQLARLYQARRRRDWQKCGEYSQQNVDPFARPVAADMEQFDRVGIARSEKLINLRVRGSVGPRLTRRMHSDVYDRDAVG